MLKRLLTGAFALSISLSPFAQKQLTFNGSSSYVSFGDPVFHNIQNFSVELWIKPHSLGSSYTSLLGEDNCFEFGFHNSGSQKRIHTWLEGRRSNNSSTWKSAYANYNFNLNEWHHVAVTYDGSRVKIYLDGELITNTSWSVSKLYSSYGTPKNFGIGRQIFSPSNNYYDGEMDEIRIWNKALTQEQIRAMMTQEISSVSNQVRGRYTSETITGLDFNNDIHAYFDCNESQNTLWDYHWPYQDGTFHNMATGGSRPASTAPVPYETKQNGNWSSSSTWKSGQVKPSKNWAIANVRHNVNITSNENLGYLNVSSGKSMNVLANNTLTVHDKIVNNGTVTVSNSGSILQTNSGNDNNTGGGTYSINRLGNSSAMMYHIWSSPIQNASIPTVFSGVNSCDVLAFDAIEQKWKYDYSNGHTGNCNGNNVTFNATQIISGGDGVMDEGRGYFSTGNGSGMKTFSGKVNNGNINYTLKAGSNPGGVNWTGDNWNLVGNPYPSALDVRSAGDSPNSFVAQNSAKITGEIYLWVDDNSSGSSYDHSNDYAIYSPTMGGLEQNGSGKPSGFVASGQGFWVIATQNNASLVFNNSMRKSGNNGKFFKSTNDTEKRRVWLNLTNDKNQFNQILIGEHPDATNDYDLGYDAIKADGNTLIGFSSVIENVLYAIQAVPVLDQVGERNEIELNVNAGFEGMHFIAIDSTSGMDDRELFLLDKKFEKVHDLKTGPYTFQVLTPGQIEKRFYLGVKKMKPIDPTTSVDETQVNAALNIWQSATELNVSATDQGKLKQIRMFDIGGRLLLDKAISGTGYSIQTGEFTNGVYILEVISTTGVVNKKVKL